ncbi:MAG: Gfo/Idh/MocA family oxidoreductase [Candidatus Brocadiaceae bacterium]|jgi:predicted dehydrogenase
MTAGSSTSRRSFLKTTAATIAAPFVVSARALGADAPPPSERITMGFIGVGNRGRGLAGMGRRGDTQTLAVCDVNRARIEQFASDKSITLYNDFRELLARDDIDAVGIGTPDHWHAIPVIEAAKAGKDIYCEKPLSLTIREARAMVNAVRRYGRVFQTGSQQRSAREFRFACEMVRSGRIGELQSIEAYVGGPSGDCYLPPEPVPEGVDWDMWLGPAPWRPCHTRLLHGGFRGYRDYSGGGMTDWGAHHFDIAQWGMDMDHSGPVEIIPPDGGDVRWLTYVYASGVTLTHGGPGGKGVVFNGTEGKIEVNRGHLRTWPDSLMRTPTLPDEVHLYRSPGHTEDFIRAIRTRQKPICDVEIGCRSVTVCHLGNIAYMLKRPLRWDPVKEELIGDPEASRWLDRPKREPWTLS